MAGRRLECRVTEKVRSRERGRAWDAAAAEDGSRVGHCASASLGVRPVVSRSVPLTAGSLFP